MKNCKELEKQNKILRWALDNMAYIISTYNSGVSQDEIVENIIKQAENEIKVYGGTENE